MILTLGFAFAISMIACAIIYAAIAFINGDLVPAYLAAIYIKTSPFTRLIIATLFMFPTGNYLISRVYKVTDAGHAGMMILIATVLALAGKALLMGVGELSLRVCLSIVVLICSAAWVSYELHRVGS